MGSQLDGGERKLSEITGICDAARSSGDWRAVGEYPAIRPWPAFVSARLTEELPAAKCSNRICRSSITIPAADFWETSLSESLCWCNLLHQEDEVPGSKRDAPLRELNQRQRFR
jgi:hypothetical protein